MPAPPATEVAGMNVTVSSVSEIKAWKTGVVLDVVDASLEASRKIREQAEASRAEREANEARARRSNEEIAGERARAEARDAQKIAQEHAARAREAARVALLIGE